MKEQNSTFPPTLETLKNLKKVADHAQQKQTPSPRPTEEPTPGTKPPTEGTPSRETRRELLEAITKQLNMYLNVSMAQHWKNHEHSATRSTGNGYQNIIKLGGMIREMSWLEDHFNRAINQRPRGRECLNHDQELAKEKIYEAVELLPVTKDDFEVIEVHDKQTVSSWIFFTKTKEVIRKERKKISRLINYQEVQQGGVNEPAMALFYRTIFEAPFIDYSGRSGNYLQIGVILPETIALKIFEEIQNDPVFAREIAKVAALSMDISPTQWENGDEQVGTPVCPPYKLWEKEGATKMLLVEPGKPEKIIEIL